MTSTSPSYRTEPADHTLAVLAYHKFGSPPANSDGSWYYVSAASFRSHLTLLQDHGWSVVDLRTVLEGLAAPESLPPKAALITFDDAYRSVLELACPILAEFGYPAVVFVPTGYVAGASRFDDATSEPVEEICSVAELRELQAAGVSAQSHGVSHVKLSTLSATQMSEELKGSRAFLEDNLGERVEAFAFPYGDAGVARVVAPALEEAGYRAAFLYGGAPFRLPALDPFSLPRVPVGCDTALAAELKQVMRSDRRRHLERLVEERGRALAIGRLDEAALDALERLLTRKVAPDAQIVWVEAGLRPPRSTQSLLDFPALPGGTPKVFSKGEAGSQEAPWIAPGFAYEFRLFREGGDDQALASVTVVGGDAPEAPPAKQPWWRRRRRSEGPRLVARPNPTPLTGTHGATTVSWSTGDGSVGRVELTTYRLDEGVPEDDDGAVAAIESLSRQGADFLLFPPASLWWLGLYPGLERHLAAHHRLIAEDRRTGLLYDLRA